MKGYFDQLIKPANERLAKMIERDLTAFEPEEINDLGNWTDKDGITHIYVKDHNLSVREWKRNQDGTWVAQPPF